MFRGIYPARVDNQGRIKLPEEIRRTLEKSEDARLFITSRDGRSALIYSLSDWERAAGELADLARSDSAAEKMLAISAFYGAQAEMDPQGRLQLPEPLRESAKVANDVVVIGKVKGLEVIALDEWKKQMHPLLGEDTAELDKLLNREKHLD